MADPTPSRRLRRRWKILGSLLLLVGVLILGLPWFLESRLVRPRIVAGLNRAFAPGKLQFDGIELGWFRPTRLSKVVLLDPNDKVVARVPFAVLNRSLAKLIFPAREPVVLTLESASLEVERSATGKIDLAQALQSIMAHPDPDRDLTIKIDGGTLRYRDPFLAEDSEADAVDLTLRIPTAPHPVTWALKLARHDASLEIEGDFDRWLSKGGPPKSPELRVGVVGKSWPIVAKVAEVDASTKLDGSLDFARKRGKWVLGGDARLIDLKASGKLLSGDTLAIDRIEAGWDLVENEQGWTIRRLGLTSPLADLKAEGQLNGAEGTGKRTIEGKVDLASIASQLPHALKLREGLIVERGMARLSVEIDSTTLSSVYDIEAKVSDLLARDHGRALTLRDPATLTGRIVTKGKDSSVERLALKSSFLEASASGRFEEGVKLEANLDLEKFRNQLGDWIDLGGLEMAGKARLGGTYLVQAAGSRDTPDRQVGNAKDIPYTGSPQMIHVAQFFHQLKADLRDFRIDGLGVGPIRQDSLSIQLTASGPVDSSGFPEGWKAALVQIKRNQSEARLRLDSGSETTAISARVQTPIAQGDRGGVARLDLAGEWSGDRRNLKLSEIALSNVGSKNPAIEATGSLDLSRGELVIEPRPGRGTDAVTIAPDGIRVSGLGQGLGSLRFEGGLAGDSAALDRLLADLSGRSPLGFSGRWSAMANARGDGDGLRIAAKVGLVETTAATSKPTRPTSMAISAHYSPGPDRVEFSEFAVSTAYGTLDASGRLDQPMGARRIDLSGKLSPDFAVITGLLAAKVEPGARVEGKPRTFRASGSIGDSSGGWKGLDAEFGFDLLGADIYGMKFGATPVVLRAKSGKLSFDPISTSINEGHIRLEPEIDLEAQGGPTLRLAKNSNIREARINDEVSKRVLAFVAPILDQATRASGLVSVDLDHAEFPLGSGLGRKAKVEGAVVFQDVEFAPGPLAGDLLAAIGRRDLSLKLDQPVTLTIAEGRINQRGMSVPVGDLTRLELSGWVDFDRNLGLVATVPVTPSMLGNNPLLSDIAAGTQVKLPISGTLDHPVIDREAFSNNLQELGKTLLTRGATRGALELLMRLSRPRDPDAPPPPPRMTPEERKAQRLEKKAIRRGEIPDPPKS